MKPLKMKQWIVDYINDYLPPLCYEGSCADCTRAVNCPPPEKCKYYRVKRLIAEIGQLEKENGELYGKAEMAEAECAAMQNTADGLIEDLNARTKEITQLTAIVEKAKVTEQRLRCILEYQVDLQFKFMFENIYTQMKQSQQELQEAFAAQEKEVKN